MCPLNNVWFKGKHWLRVSVLIGGLENNAAAKKAVEADAVIWSYHDPPIQPETAGSVQPTLRV
jgi:hypothetical protein